MPYHNFLFFILFFCITFWSVQSQEYVLKFQNITTKEGLSDNRINDVLQDSNGLLWAINNLSIDRYNGKETKKYYIDSDAIANHLLEDSHGNIWVITTKGLFIYKEDKNEFIKLKSDNPTLNKLLDEHIIQLIEVDHNRSFWFICNSVLAHFKINNDLHIDEASVKVVINENSPRYTALVEGKNQSLWVSNNLGQVFKYDYESLEKVLELNHTSESSINAISVDNNNLLWIGTNGNGLFRFDPTDKKLIHFLHEKDSNESINNNIVLSLLNDSNDNIWIGTDGGGLNLFQKKSQSFYFFQQSFNKDYSISDNSVLSVRQGLDNTLLAATVHGGISIFKNRLDIKRISADKLDFNYKDEQSSSILEDGDHNIWLSAGREGLRTYNPVTHRVTTFIDDPNNPTDLSGSIILALQEDQHHRIWIGTLRGGLNIYDTKTKRFLQDFKGRATRRIYAISEAETDYMWVGSSNGICVYDSDLNIIDHINVAAPLSLGNNVKVLYKDIKGDMWVGTEMGLHCYQKTTTGYEKKSYYSDPKDSTSLSSNHIISITETDDLSLMVGTYGKGVDLYSRTTNSFQKLKTKNRIEGSIIRGILKDHHQNIWFSTNTGLSKMDSKGNVINLTINEGVQAFKGGAAALSHDGTILMAGSQGLTYFNPEELILNSALPKVFFTTVNLVNKQKESDDSLNLTIPLNRAVIDTPVQLSSNTASFTVNFSSSYFYAPEDLKYAYKLEGINDTWQMIDNTKNLTFSSLKPGDYILKVKVANEFEEWSPNIASLKLTVNPSFWQKKTTKLILVLFVIGLLVFLYKWRIATVKEQKEKLQHLLKIKTEEVKKQQDEVYQGRIAVLNAEKANQKLNQKKLRDELKFKIDELTNHTLRTVHKNNLLTDIRDKLNLEIKQPKTDKQHLKNIISLINDSFSLDKDWKSFYSIFNQVHPTFIEDLKSYCPKLSERDMQLCALIKLNFSSQHMATLFGISLSSVKVARHRLRKKLNIEEGSTLKGFISEFSSGEN